MIVKNYEEKVKKESSECLFERFGSGVYLIINKDNTLYNLMIITSKYADVIFIENENFITKQSNIDNKIPYKNFSEYWKIIRKLKVDELIIEVKQ